MPSRPLLRDPHSTFVDEREGLRRLSDFEAAVARVTAYMLAHRIRIPALLTVGGTCFGLFVGIASAAGFDHDGPTQKIARVERAAAKNDSTLWAELGKQSDRIDRLEVGQAAIARAVDTVDVRTSRMEVLTCVIARLLAPDARAPGCAR